MHCVPFILSIEVTVTWHGGFDHPEEQSNWMREIRILTFYIVSFRYTTDFPSQVKYIQQVIEHK